MSVLVPFSGTDVGVNCVEVVGPSGIALAAFVMAMFFSPSLTALIGQRAWWPGHGDRAAKLLPAEREPASRALR